MLITPTMMEPNKVPRIDPRPPNSEMPPITAAVMAWRLKSVTTVEGLIEPLRPIDTQGRQRRDQAGYNIRPTAARDRPGCRRVEQASGSSPTA